MKKKNLFLLLPAMLALAGCSIDQLMDTVKDTAGNIIPGLKDDGEDKEEEPKGHVHNFETLWSTDATHHWHSCKDETCSEKSNYGEHDFDGVQWDIVVQPTTEQDGLKKRACSICGYEQSETIPAIVHNHEYDSSVWQYDDNTHWNKCSGCSEKLNEASHDYTGVQWTTVTQATESTAGLKTRTCNVCGYLDEEVIPVGTHSHTFSESWTSDSTGHWHAATCEHTEEKSDFSAHTYGSWSEESAPTADNDGVEARTCTACSYKDTRPIPKKDLKVNYGFANYKDYTMTDTVYGLKMDVAGTCGDGYDGLYLSMGGIKKENATSYTFKIKNNGTDKFELRMGYRNSTSKVYANSQDVNDYSIVSLNNKSDTKVKEVKSSFIRFGIAGGDTADLVVALTSQDYDQFIFMPVHAGTAVSLTVIQTGYVEAQHNWKSEWSYDNDYHWHDCEDANCAFVSDKAKHTWVADTTKTDIPATETDPGTAYKICSVCSATKTVEIPVSGGPTERDVDMMALGFVANNSYTVSQGDGKLEVTYSQPASTYNKMKVNNISSQTFTRVSYISLKLKSLATEVRTFCVTAKDATTYFIPNGATNLEVVSSELGTSSVERVGSTCAYLTVGAGDTVEYKMPTLACTSMTELSLFIKPGSAEITGSFELYKFSVHDVLAETQTDGTEEAYGTWTGFTGCTTSKNQDKTTTVSYTQTSDTAYSSLNCSDFGTLIASFSKPIKTISLEIINLNNWAFHSCLAIKDNNGIISASGGTSVDGDASFVRHSSGSGEYFNVAANGTGTVTATITDGSSPTKLRILVDYDNLEVAGSIKVGKITFGF